MSKEAMKLALEALESQRFSKVIEAKNALEEALKQEPVAEPHKGEQINSTTSMSLTSQNGANHKQEQVEPVVVMTRYASLCSPKFAEQLKSGDVFKLYTTPQQRTWVGLTDYEIGVCSTEAAMNRNDMVGGAVIFAKAIEAKLKEKNTRNGGCL
jgi:hypothetical protein